MLAFEFGEKTSRDYVRECYGNRACKSLYTGATRKPLIVFSYSVQNKGKLTLTSLVVVNVHSLPELGHTCAFRPHAVKIAAWESSC